jgi:mannose-6-phosphate isomerase-like protein (cupin superfamily)
VSGRLDLQSALRSLPSPPAEQWVELFEHGTLSIGLYAPQGTDPQTPHTRDEVYVVAAGSGQFVVAGATRPFGPGDVLFVPAGVEHRFLEFSRDFAAWVLFYGPEGGE